MQLKLFLKKVKSRLKSQLKKLLEPWWKAQHFEEDVRMEPTSKYHQIDSTFLSNTAKKLTDYCGHQEYHQIQLVWTSDVWKIAPKYFPEQLSRCLDIGAFTGINSIAFSSLAQEVIAMDQHSFLPDWLPPNIHFCEADIDTADWEGKIPAGPYDVCFMVEVLEHLRWSPIPFLKWLNKHVNLLVITTPDDAEWPSIEIHPWSQFGHYRYIPTAFPGCTGNPSPMYHVKQYQQHEFVELLSECDFRVLELNRVGTGKHQLVAVCQPRRLGC